MNISWFGFWLFAAAVALANGMASAFGPPSSYQIQIAGRNIAAAELAKRGASPIAIHCILEPPYFSFYCVDILKSQP